jgi:hypothetical protein
MISLVVHFTSLVVSFLFVFKKEEYKNEDNQNQNKKSDYDSCDTSSTQSLFSVMLIGIYKQGNRNKYDFNSK